MQRPHPLAQEGRMTDNKHSDAYREAMDDYEAAKAGAGNCVETFTRFLVAERVLAEPAAGTTGQTRRSPDTPPEFGPFTPEAKRAFEGGGMILQGAPGEPAPRPEPTPPGQTPRNMV